MSIVPGTKTISGTPQYMAPEVMQSQPQGLRVDMYSVGVVMWEMMTGVRYFASASQVHCFTSSQVHKLTSLFLCICDAKRHEVAHSALDEVARSARSSARVVTRSRLVESLLKAC